MRRNAKVDVNQPSIVKNLREIGATVKPLHFVGQGFPDIIVGWQGANFLIELKDENKPPSKQKLTTDEIRFHEAWKGQISICNSFEQCLEVIGAT